MCWRQVLGGWGGQAILMHAYSGVHSSQMVEHKFLDLNSTFFHRYSLKCLPQAMVNALLWIGCVVTTRSRVATRRAEA